MNKYFPAIAFIVFGVLTSYLSLSDSYAYNENGRLASGLAYIQTGDYTSFHVNPPLVSLVGALPAALLGAERAKRSKLGITRFGRGEYRAKRFLEFQTPPECCVLFLCSFTRRKKK